jgi:hypothetical protein
MKKFIIIIILFAILPKVYSQDKKMQLNYNIFFDGQFRTDGIRGNFLFSDTISNISFIVPFEYRAGNLEIESKEYEKINLFNKPIITMEFEKDFMFYRDFISRSYSIDIPYKTFNNSYVNIKIYNKESKKYRKYWKQKTEYVVDLGTGSGLCRVQLRTWKSRKRIKQFFTKEECDKAE